MYLKIPVDVVEGEEFGDEMLDVRVISGIYEAMMSHWCAAYTEGTGEENSPSSYKIEFHGLR